jgi:peptidoglycan-associated lipoprotein
MERPGERHTVRTGRFLIREGKMTSSVRLLSGASVVCSLLLAACATENPAPASNAAPGAVFNVPSAPQQTYAIHPQPAQGTPSAPKGAAPALPAQRSVYYDLDRYDIKPEFRPAIEAHARYLREHGQAHVTIQGNGDERGSREYNLALGQKRAEGVRQMMRVSGAQDQQLEAISFGEEKPKAPGHDEAAWAQNRRSDLVYDRSD